MAAKRDVKYILLEKIEASYGTDSTPTGVANAILARRRDFPQLGTGDYIDRQLMRTWLGRGAATPKANSRVAFGYDIEAAGSGTAGTAPAWGNAVRKCGFAEVVNAGVSVVYNPISAAEESSSCYWNIDGLQQKVLGTRGSLGLSFVAGQVPLINIDAVGLYAAPTDTALPSPTWTAWKDPLVVSQANTPTFTLHGFAAVCRELTLSMNQDRVFRDWMNTKLVDMGQRQPGGSVTLELPTIAAKDYFAADQAGTLAALQLVHGTVAGNIIQIDAPKVQVMNPRFASQNGIALLTLDLGLVPNAGNDEITITAK
jgi:hypothetical protein